MRRKQEKGRNRKEEGKRTGKGDREREGNSTACIS